MMNTKVTEKMETSEQEVAMPRIGDKAPAIAAVTTQGEVHFPADYLGKWIILFSQPAGVRPAFSPELRKPVIPESECPVISGQLRGVSIHGFYSHTSCFTMTKDKISFKGVKNMEVTFPLGEAITLESVQQYSQKFLGEDSSKAFQSVFFINPEGVIRVAIYYPLSLSIEVDNLKSAIMSLKKTARKAMALSTDWRSEINIKEDGVTYYDWFSYTKELSLEKINHPHNELARGQERMETLIKHYSQ